MLFAFLTLGQWLILACILVALVLLSVPGTRPYVRAILRSVKTLISCLVLSVLLVASSIPIYADLEYFLVGHEGEATVTKVEHVRNGVRVEYRFIDADGTPQTGTDRPDVGWNVAPGKEVMVQYLSGEEEHSRLSRRITHWLPYALFIGSALMLLLTIALVVRWVNKGALPAL